MYLKISSVVLEEPFLFDDIIESFSVTSQDFYYSPDEAPEDLSNNILLNNGIEKIPFSTTYPDNTDTAYLQHIIIDKTLSSPAGLNDTLIGESSFDECKKAFADLAPTCSENKNITFVKKSYQYSLTFEDNILSTMEITRL